MAERVYATHLLHVTIARHENARLRNVLSIACMYVPHKFAKEQHTPIRNCSAKVQLAYPRLWLVVYCYYSMQLHGRTYYLTYSTTIIPY